MSFQLKFQTNVEKLRKILTKLRKICKITYQAYWIYSGIPLSLVNLATGEAYSHFWRIGVILAGKHRVKKGPVFAEPEPQGAASLLLLSLSGA
jgi:hypothetical protein